MHQRESLCVIDNRSKKAKSTTDEMTMDGCQFLSTAEIDTTGHLHVHVHGSSTKYFQDIIPLIDIECVMKDGNTVRIEKTLSVLYSRLHELLNPTKHKHIIDDDIDVDTEMDVSQIKALKVHHYTRPVHV